MNLRDVLIYQHDGETIAVDEVSRARLLGGRSPAAVIQDALDQVGRHGGGEVRLASGTYLLDRPLRLAERTVLSGRGPGTVVGATETFAGEAAIVVEAVRGAGVRQLTVSALIGAQLDNGVILRRSPQTALENVAVGGTAGAGFIIEQNSILTQARGCIAAGNARCGFLFRQNYRGPYGDFVPVAAHDCLVYGGGKGFEFDNAIVVNVTGSSVYQTRGPAFHLHNMSNSVLISGCRTFQIGGDAYVSEESNEINVSGNIFCWHEGVGIRLRRVCWGTISGNNIIDTGSYNPDAPDLSVSFAQVGERAKPVEGMSFEETRGVVVSGNAFFNWHVCPPLAHAIREDAASADNTYVGNNLNYLAGEPIVAAGSGTTVANNTVHAERPHVHYYGRQQLLPPHDQKVQSFQPELTRRLISDLFGPPPPAPSV